LSLRDGTPSWQSSISNGFGGTGLPRNLRVLKLLVETKNIKGETKREQSGIFQTASDKCQLIIAFLYIDR